MWLGQSIAQLSMMQESYRKQQMASTEQLSQQSALIVQEHQSLKS